MTVDKSPSIWSAFCSYGIDALNKLGQVVAPNSQMQEVQKKLISGIVERFRSSGETIMKKLEIKRKQMADSLLALVVKTAHSRSKVLKFLRGTFATFFSDRELNAPQEEACVPEELHVEHASHSWTCGRCNYKKLFSDESTDKDLSEEEIQSISQIDEDVIEEVVTFIVSKCHLNSWGEKRFPVGDSDATTILLLTCMLGLMEMWREHKRSKESEKLPFRQIVEAEGPLMTHDE